MVRVVHWPLPVQKQLEKVYQYILLNSYQNAEKVKAAILDSTGKLPGHPEMHPPDKYRKNNDGSFRAYEIHRYRLSFVVSRCRGIFPTHVRICNAFFSCFHTTGVPLFKERHPVDLYTEIIPSSAFLQVEHKVLLLTCI